MDINHQLMHPRGRINLISREAGKMFSQTLSKEIIFSSSLVVKKVERFLIGERPQ